MNITHSFRNIARNKRRTILTAFAIAIGMAATVLTNGFINHSLWGLKHSMIQEGLGHIQVFHQGHIEHGEDDPAAYALPNYQVIAKHINAIDGVDFVAPRLALQGLLSDGEHTAVITGFAGDIDQEQHFNFKDSLIEGSYLSDEDPDGIVIGSRLAKRIGASVGSNYTLMVSMRSGGINAVDVHVRGILTHRVAEMDQRFLVADHTLAESLMDCKGETDRLIVMLKDDEAYNHVANAINELNYEVPIEWKKWSELADFYHQVKEMYMGFFAFLFIIIIGIIIFSISNTMTMMMMERIKEVGMLRAIGVGRISIARMFMQEGALVGLIGALAGLLFGVFMAWTINRTGGITMPPPPGSTKAYEVLITPDPQTIGGFAIAFVIVAVIGAFYPAYRSTRINIINAISWR